MFHILKDEGAPKQETAVPILLHNTLSGKKEVFEPLKPGLVGMYNCGPTVYDYATIGNLRSYIFADTLKRMFLFNGYKVKQIVNVTDFGHLTSDADEGEDKMAIGLKREGLPLTLEGMGQLADKYIEAFLADIDKLLIRHPNELPRASEHVGAMIALIKTLEERGYTYQTSDGIYFDTSRFPDYGKLGKINIEGQKAGARVEGNAEKRNPADFAIWKLNSEIGWESPWGMGFPGWHIECSAMSMHYLGKTFDIHTGGIDHIPVHHNNEIAQSESATKKQYVRYWLHNEFITIEGRRIGKSLGNMIRLQQIMDRGFSPLALRYWYLTGHYRSPMNFTWDAIEGAHAALFRLHRYFVEELGEKNGRAAESYRKRFQEFINDDLDTPKAIALLWELVKDERVSNKDKRITMLTFDKVLGIGLIEGYKRFNEMLPVKVIPVEDLPEDVRDLIHERESARKEKDWEKADSLRNTIEEKGYRVSDTEEGPEVTVA